MKKTLIVLLIVLVAVTGLPILMGGSGMVHCQDCAPATFASCGFALFSAAAALFLVLVSTRLRRRSDTRFGLPNSFALERPPQRLA